MDHKSCMYITSSITVKRGQSPRSLALSVCFPKPQASGLQLLPVVGEGVFVKPLQDVKITSLSYLEHRGTWGRNHLLTLNLRCINVFGNDYSYFGTGKSQPDGFVTFLAKDPKSLRSPTGPWPR